jgi:hypothetical protein
MSRTIYGEFYRTDINGVILEDLSTQVLAGNVEYSAQRSGSTPLLGRFTLKRADLLEPMVSFVSPFLILIEEDGTVSRRRMGIYQASIPSERHLPRRAEPTYELRDLTALLARGASQEPYVVESGTNIVTALAAVAALAGITRVAFPASTRTTGYKRTFPAGTPWIEIFNKLCEAFGWYPGWMGLDGKLTTRPQQLLSETTPITTLTEANLTGELQVVPNDPDQVANIVVVVRDRADQGPLQAILVNDDPSSPTSTLKIGPHVYGGGPYEVSDAETQDDVDAIADRLFEQARSYERVVTARVHPDVRLLGMFRTLDLDISTSSGAHLRGKYWLRDWSAGFTPRDAAMTLSLNRLVRFGRGEDR